MVRIATLMVTWWSTSYREASRWRCNTITSIWR